VRDLVEQALKGHDADYVEVRLEDSEATRIQYRGRDLEEINRTTSKGGNARALVKGGWGFVSFNDLSDLREKVALAVRQARLVGNETSELAEVEPVVDIVPARLGKDPLAIPIAEKKRLLDEYNDIIWSTEKIQSSSIGYSDGRRKVTFANSAGSYIEQSKVDVSMRINAMARADGDVQQSGISIGSNGDFAVAEGLHDQVRDIAQRAVDFLSAPYAEGGDYTVVLDPILAGVFVHEAFGHLSEADHIYENDRMREIMVLGKRFGEKNLNIVDGAAVPDLRGSYKYDDEGVPSTKTDLIREGVLVGRLHSRETAAKMGEPTSGNARAISFQFPPIVRMTNTYIEPQDVSFDDMIADIKDGIYARNWYGGMTSMEMFTFSAGEAYRIRNGKLEELVRPVVLSGNLFETLKVIDAIGNDLDMNQGGGCGKGGQSPLPVTNGSPHIRIAKCLVGGK
jgi:TldD protein